MSEKVQVSANGLLFDVATSGHPDSDAVLFLHGFPQNSYAWRAQLAAVADAGYFGIAPDQRGYSPGARPKGIASYAMTHLVDDAVAVADFFGFQRFHLVGHDWGGQLAWMTTIQHPDRVISLTVLSRPHPRAFLESKVIDPEQENRSRHHRTFREPGATQELIDDLEGRCERMHRQGVSWDTIEHYLHPLESFEALDAALNWYRASELAQPVAAVSVPTVYLWGTNDGTVGRIAAELTEKYVNATYRFVELEDVGHFSTDQVPDVITRELLAHLSANNSSN